MSVVANDSMDDDEVADQDAEEVEEVEGANIDEISDDNAKDAESDPESYTVGISPLFAASACITAVLLAIVFLSAINGSLGPIALPAIIIAAIISVSCMPIAVWTYRKLDHFPSQGIVYLFLFSTIISGVVFLGVGSLAMLFFAMSILFKKRLINNIPTLRVM